jgi:hypothetical protein
MNGITLKDRSKRNASRPSRFRQGAVAQIEPLERRQLLSGGYPLGAPAADKPVAHTARSVAAPRRHNSISFPTAPFSDAIPIFVNQFGSALLKHVPFNSQTPIGKYSFSMDDPGNVTFTADGTIPMDMAFYNATSQPTSVDARGLTSGLSVSGNVAPTKQTEYVVIQPHTSGQTGLYNLHVNGVAVTVPGWDSFVISTKTNSGWGHTSISGGGDFDFWRFTAPVTGNYLIAVHPLSGLDSTMTVFNAKGTPVGGTFTQPIDNPGVGKIETFTEALSAGQQGIVRVDGAGPSTGWYIVSAKLIAEPSVNVVASVPTAHAGSGNPGQFTVTTTVPGKRAFPVNYTLSGTAANGQNYQALSGTAWIPAGQFSTNVAIQPIGGFSGNKNVVLTLSADSNYVLGGAGSAVVSILN